MNISVSENYRVLGCVVGCWQRQGESSVRCNAAKVPAALLAMNLDTGVVETSQRRQTS